MAQKNANGDWLDSQGKARPASFVKPIDKKRDATVERCFRRVDRLIVQMAKVKDYIHQQLDKYEAEISEKYGKGPSPGGNLTITGFSGDLQIQRAVQQKKTFNELLGVALKLIDGCRQRWSEGAHANYVAVSDAVLIDADGNVKHQAVLDLRKLNISDPEWKQAMDLVNEAYVVYTSSTYLRVLRKDPKTGKLKNVSLNFSNL